MYIISIFHNYRSFFWTFAENFLFTFHFIVFASWTNNKTIPWWNGFLKF